MFHYFLIVLANPIPAEMAANMKSLKLVYS